MPDMWKSMTDGFMPHGFCLHWDAKLLSAFIVGNLGIAIAYFLIPAALRFFVGKRKDLPYPYMFSLFAAFILSCGLTHILKVWTIYQPAYWIEAIVDLWTAGVSLVTAALLIPIIPKALKLRSPAELDQANQQLAALNAELNVSKEGLKRTVADREGDLKVATERARKSEVEFQQLFDFMPQLAWTAKPDGFVDFFNKGWFEYTGTTPEQMQGWGWESVIDPQVLPEVKKLWSASIADGATAEMEFPLRGADGVFRTFLTAIKPIKDEAGRVQRWVGINTNIQYQKDTLYAIETSERKFREELERLVKERTEQLERALDDALIANRTKNQFVSTVSHEVRTPMAGVIGLAEVLSLSPDVDSETKLVAGEIFNASKRLLSILNDILDFAKFESGRLQLEYRMLSPRHVIEEVIQSSLSAAAKKGLHLVNEVDDQLPEQVCGDELRLRQVLTNLITNAIKFTETGSVTVSGKLQETDESKLKLYFAVKDTGIGVEEEAQKRLFVPFSQADNSITRRFGGTGLGLAICKNYVELMGGEIGLESESGKGATFWFTVILPVGENSP